MLKMGHRKQILEKSGTGKFYALYSEKLIRENKFCPINFSQSENLDLFTLRACHMKLITSVDSFKDLQENMIYEIDVKRV